MAGDMPFFLATLEQCVAHCSTFHVAVAPSCSCMVQYYNFVADATPDSLDVLLHHIMQLHLTVYDNGR